MMRFDEWLDEHELPGSPRIWRFMDDINSSDPSQNTLMIRWLKAAYEEGYNQARYDTMKLYWDDGK